MRFVCSFCLKESDRPTGEVNRAIRSNLPLFCNRVCSGLGRRKNKTPEQKKQEKRQYDMEYRANNRAMLRAKKAAYYQRARDPVKEAVKRKERMHLHIEYCRQPKYRAWKQEYDRTYRAKKFYGDFWESFLICEEIDREVDSRMDWNDVRAANGILNKAQQRRRAYERIISVKSQNCPLGNA